MTGAKQQVGATRRAVAELLEQGYAGAEIARALEKVKVRLTKGGNETLRGVQIALQLPQGWTAQPVGRTFFRRLAPSQAAIVKFLVTLPSWAPSTDSVVHATADLGPDAQREDGVTVRVG